MNVESCDRGSGVAVVQLSRREVVVLSSALNEVLNGISILDFPTRLAMSRENAADLRRELSEVADRLRPPDGSD